MVQGAKHMKSNNAADNGGSNPQPKPQPKPKRRRNRLPRWPTGSSPSSSSLLAWAL